MKPPLKLRVLALAENKQNAVFSSPECQQLLKIYDDYYPQIGFNIPWVAYFILRDDKVVGSCSFTGKPKNGEVEIAYWTFEEFEGQGIATFACSELVKIAKNTDPDIRITAKTAPEQNASTKILEKNGFNYSGVVQDEDIGDAWSWFRN